jgi:hypothetical protein
VQQVLDAEDAAARLMRCSMSVLANFRILSPNAMLEATLMCG